MLSTARISVVQSVHLVTTRKSNKCHCEALLVWLFNKRAARLVDTTGPAVLYDSFMTPFSTFLSESSLSKDKQGIKMAKGVAELICCY